MITRIKQWLEPPHFEDDEEMTAHARALNTLIINFGAALLVFIFILVPFFAVQKIGGLILLIPPFVGLFIGRALIFRRQVRLGSAVIIWLSYLSFFSFTILAGGPNSPGMFFMSVLILITGFFISVRAANNMVMFTIVAALGIIFLGYQGLALPKIFVLSPLTGWIAFALGLFFMNSARNLILRNLERALSAERQQNTLLKQTEQSLRESEEKFKAQYMSIPIPTFTWQAVGDDLILVDYNKAGLEFTSGRIVNLLGKTASFAYRDDPGTFNEFIECSRTKSNSKIERWHRLASTGEVKYVAFNYAFVPPDLVMVHTEDITERKRMEDILRESEETYKLMFESAPLAINITRGTDITYANPSYVKMFGFSSLDELKSVSPVELFTPESRPQILENIQRRAKELPVPNSYESECFRKDGTRFPILMHLARATFADGPATVAFILDITESKRAEEALRSATADYRAIFENTPIGIFQSTPQGRFRRVNPAMARIFGYASPEEMIESITDISHQIYVHPHERENFQRTLAEHEEVIEFIGENYCKDKTIVWTQTTARAVKDAHGNIQLYEGFITDITERKRAEEALRASETSYRGLFDTVGEAIYILDREGRFLDVNLGAAKMYGYPREYLIGKTPEDVSAPGKNDLAGVAQKVQSAFKGETQQFEFWGLRSNGSIFPKDVRLYQGVYFGQDVVIALASDISERKQAEEQIFQSEKKYRGLFQVNKDGIAIFLQNPHGPPSNFVEVNESAAVMLGYTQEEMLKLTPQMLLDPHTNVGQIQFRRPEFTSKGITNFETTLMHKDGHKVFAEFTGQLIKYEGQPAVMNIVRDITERKHHESELRAIATLSAALRTAETRAEMLPVIVKQMVVLLNCDTASVEIVDPQTGDAVTEAAHGTWKALVGTHQKSGTGINAIISQTRKPYYTNDLNRDPNFMHPELVSAGFQGGIGAPLIAQDHLIGFIWMARKNNVSETEVRLLASIADIAANAIYRATLHEQTKKDAEDLTLAYDTTLEGWAHALELRDYETEGHTRRVVQMTVDLARAMGIEGSGLESIRRGALLHDIGKMGIPDSILRKPGSLDEREWEIMRQHPEYAYKLLEPIKYLRPALEIPHYHHEKWDGTGYPDGLKREKIPTAARIFSVVDVWDALTSDRPYRPAWSKEKALAHIVEQTSKHFDPAVVDAFLKIV